MNKKFIFSLILITILSSAFVLAQGLGPGVPHQFYGTATYNGAGANGLTVDVYIEGVKVGSTTTLNGQYGYYPVFLIKDPEGEYAGKTITFYLNGVNTGTTFIFENGASTKLDLSATGSAPSLPGGGSGDGGGGGGGGGGGTTTPKTSTTTGATVTSTTPTTTTETGGDNQETTEQTTEQKGFFSGITGAVIGAVGTPAAIGVLIFIIALVAIYIYVAVMRKAKKK